MGFKPADKTVTPMVEFKTPGQTFEGFIGEITTGNTKFGPCQFINVADAETGEKKCVAMGGSLKFYPWDELKGKLVLFTYEGEQKNPKTGQTFKAIAVDVWRDEEDGEPSFDGN